MALAKDFFDKTQKRFVLKLFLSSMKKGKIRNNLNFTF